MPMAKRSLQASVEGIRKAKQAFKRKGWTQEYLAGEVSLETRQPIWKFFTGKPVDRHVFNDICFVLELDPLEIVQQPTASEYTTLDTFADTTLDIDAIVVKLRSAHHDKIQAQCETLHLLDIPRPITLNDLYVDVNVFEELTSERWLEISDSPSLDTHEFNHFAQSQLAQERILGLDAVAKYSKLIVLGKPGSGKTTFLQSIAISCNQGVFLPDYLPIFISLKHLAEDIQGHHKISLLKYLHENLENFGVSEQELITLLLHGRALILLDGLDEINQENYVNINNLISNFLDKFYRNKIIINCRLGYYIYKFQGFTEIEIADFNKLQIANFAQKWFLSVANHSSAKAQKLAHKFMQKLELSENRQILELASTPILLNLICLVFKFIEDFPTNRCELYQQALDLLLMHWDVARGIKRDQVHPDFSLLNKIKLLSHIATVSFIQKNYFQPKNKIRQIIADYLRSLPNAKTDADALELESAAMLKAIAVQHGLLIERGRGIYSFSHLVFQEYFTAKDLITNSTSQTLEKIVNSLEDIHWYNVLLLSAEMLNNADNLLQLFKQNIDKLAFNNVQLHDFLNWLKQKSTTVNTSYHPASIRAFYFTIALPLEHPLACNQDLAISLDRRLAGNLAVDLGLDLALTHALAVSLTITSDIFPQRFSALSLALDLRHLLTNQPCLQKSLQNLKNQLPLSNQGRDVLKTWWEANGKAWTEELRSLIISNRQICHNWQFNQQDLQQFQNYWYANKLMLDCLNNANNVTWKMRDWIEKNLFLVSL